MRASAPTATSTRVWRPIAEREGAGRGRWCVPRPWPVDTGFSRASAGRPTGERTLQSSEWEVNAAVAAEFARHLDGEPAPPRTAVYLTQPWPALGVMSVGNYVRHLGEVRSACEAARAEPHRPSAPRRRRVALRRVRRPDADPPRRSRPLRHHGCRRRRLQQHGAAQPRRFDGRAGRAGHDARDRGARGCPEHRSARPARPLPERRP